jgi:hypothetical protein
MTAQVSTDVNGALGDAVRHPKHYNSHPSGIECVEFSELLPGNLAHVCVYVWRHAHKGRPIEDLEKALWFLERELRRTRTEHDEESAHLKSPVPAARIDERLRRLMPFVRDGEFVAVAVNHLLHYHLTEAQTCITHELAMLRGA